MDIAKTIRLAPGHYVLAVSGGVDSMVLLDILSKLEVRNQKISLTVAHFDHGIRPDSREDRKLIEEITRRYKLPFVYAEGALGEGASEEQARAARYKFLGDVQKNVQARGIITAHHLDDVVETATHNLLRGTGRKGMSSLKSVDGIIRPLLQVPKNHLLTYARDNGLAWREDSTNQDLRYKRNYIRHVILPKLRQSSPEKFHEFRTLIKRQAELNQAIDAALYSILHTQPELQTLRRYDVITLPHNVARELVGEWLRLNGKREFNRRHLERATVALKTAKPNTVLVLDGKYQLVFDTKHARLVKS